MNETEESVDWKWREKKTYAHTSVFTSCVTSLPWFTTYIQLPCLLSAACGCTNWVRVSHNCCRPKAIWRFVRLRCSAESPSVSRTILVSFCGIDRWNLITDTVECACFFAIYKFCTCLRLKILWYGKLYAGLPWYWFSCWPLRGSIISFLCVV